MALPGHNSNRAGGVAGERLRSLIERIERLEEEKASIAADIRDIYAEAKGNGFDPKTMRHIIKLRKMEHAEREEHEALIDIYKASLGMLDGTPLGEAAIKRLTKEAMAEGENPGAFPDASEPEQAANADPLSGITVQEARDMGRQAALEGEPVTSNPFPARDPRRSAWDEEWCMTAGSDGMELPEAWRRSPKKGHGGSEGGATGEAA
ncbi:DUF2312 domain-containing protein [Tautonia plasticadhaerens]|uniref:DUF2312 domain-containing protein n=1 Tax=Tautonia plasticadhaerens TaxID=2527974 RepID=UPI0011A43290|nr:DUF2312 domain-containing protein [Tautonia plasticadhaerens]